MERSFDNVTSEQLITDFKVVVADAEALLKAALHFLKQHPALLAGGGILLAALRPVRVVRWLRRGWVAWRVLRGLRGMMPNRGRD